MAVEALHQIAGASQAEGMLIAWGPSDLKFFRPSPPAEEAGGKVFGAVSAQAAPAYASSSLLRTPVAPVTSKAAPLMSLAALPTPSAPSASLQQITTTTFPQHTSACFAEDMTASLPKPSLPQHTNPALPTLILSSIPSSFPPYNTSSLSAPSPSPPDPNHLSPPPPSFLPLPTQLISFANAPSDAAPAAPSLLPPLLPSFADPPSLSHAPSSLPASTHDIKPLSTPLGDSDFSLQHLPAFYASVGTGLALEALEEGEGEEPSAEELLSQLAALNATAQQVARGCESALQQPQTIWGVPGLSHSWESK